MGKSSGGKKKKSSSSSSCGAAGKEEETSTAAPSSVKVRTIHFYTKTGCSGQFFSDQVKYHDDHYCVSVLRKYYEPSAFCSTDDGWPASKEPMEKAWRGAL